MVRIKSSVTAHKRKKRVLKDAKGQWGSRSKHYKEAIRSVRRGKVFAFRDRKVRKREFRYLWIVRIKAACELAGMSYSRFIKGLENAKVTINRKILADLAMNSTAAFNKLVDVAKQAAQPEAATVTVSKVVKAAKKA
jgi:large subunit ribosomal protein L20